MSRPGFISVDSFLGLINADKDVFTNYTSSTIRLFIQNEEYIIPEDLGGCYIADGRTMIPLRAVSEALGLEVTWNADTKTIGLVPLSGAPLELKVGSDEIVRDGEVTQMDTACVLKDSRTYVPLRFVSNALGSNLTWEGRGYHFINIFNE